MDWEARVAALTLDQVLAFVRKAWETRHDDPRSWRDLARTVVMARMQQNVHREAETALLEGREIERGRMDRILEGQEGEEGAP
jgi:hypothetical protein